MIQEEFATAVQLVRDADAAITEGRFEEARELIGRADALVGKGPEFQDDRRAVLDAADEGDS